MAELIRVGDYANDSEKSTAAFLREQLPAGWTIVANVTLRQKNAPEIDLVVVGENVVFVCEEKNWSSPIALGGRFWRIGPGNLERTSPVFAVENKAKIMATEIKRALTSYAQIEREKPVKALVLLTYPDLDLRGKRESFEAILRLNEVVGWLLEVDKTNLTHLSGHREKLIEHLSGLPARHSDIDVLGDYEVTRLLDESNLTKRFEAFHRHTGRHVMLYCFPEDSPSNQQNIAALESLKGTNRTWNVSPAFDVPNWNWLAVPFDWPAGSARLRHFEFPQKGSQVDAEQSNDEIAQLFADAFNGLSEIHSEGVVHRSLTPDRIWIGKSRRVLFHDFYLARVPASGTISLNAMDPAGLPFAAPECAENLHLATPASDVFSLALCLVSWWSSGTVASAKDARNWLADRGHLGEALVDALDDVSAKRPSAQDLGVALGEIFKAVKVPERSGGDQRFEKDERVGSYIIKEQLASGGSGHVWLAEHPIEQKEYVLKQLHSLEAFEVTREHLAAARKVRHESCPEYKDISENPAPGFVVFDFVPGMTLKEKHEREVLSAEAFRGVIVDGLNSLDEAFHSRGLVHGDISPGNLLIGDDGRVHFLDLELVSEIGSTPEVPRTTLAVAPPEFLAGDKKYTVQSDIYSFCATLLTIMLSRAPYEGLAHDIARSPQPLHLTPKEQEAWGPDGRAIIDALFLGIEVAPGARPHSAKALGQKIALARAIPVNKLPEVDQIDLVNPIVTQLRQTFVGSRAGNEGALAIRNAYFDATYIDTKLDEKLFPEILSGAIRQIFLSGNPGDGKTTFIQNVRARLEALGAKFESDDSTEWVALYGNRTYRALLDGSESSGNLSSNARILGAVGSSLADSTTTSIIAINDGRLSQFIHDNDGDFEDLERAHTKYLSKQVAQSGSTLIVDLKSRALTGQDSGGIAGAIVEKAISQSLWEDQGCSSCASQYQCPILENIKFLRGGASGGIELLTRLSYIASRRRATVREFRSTFAKIVTADVGCEDVHVARARGHQLWREPAARLWNIAFDSSISLPIVEESSSNDESPSDAGKLLDEWGSWDPERLIGRLPEAPVDQLATDEDGLLPMEIRRKRFFGTSLTTNAERLELLPYKHAGAFITALADTSAADALLGEVLLGLSKAFGAHGVVGSGLWVTNRESTADYQFLKRLDVAAFSLLPQQIEDSWTESFPAGLELRYSSASMIRTLFLNLDVFEFIMRARDGEIFGDAESSSLLQQMGPFIRELNKDVSGTTILVDMAGRRHEVSLSDFTIKYEELS
jgi:serine/threonine protein kinase